MERHRYRHPRHHSLFDHPVDGVTCDDRRRISDEPIIGDNRQAIGELVIDKVIVKAVKPPAFPRPDPLLSLSPK